MTQKFWNNWQKRCGETKTICLVNPMVHPVWRGNLLDSIFHKFENFEFTPDIVTIKFFDKITHTHKKVTFERTNIKTVEFY